LSWTRSSATPRPVSRAVPKAATAAPAGPPARNPNPVATATLVTLVPIVQAASLAKSQLNHLTELLLEVFNITVHFIIYYTEFSC